MVSREASRSREKYSISNAARRSSKIRQKKSSNSFHIKEIVFKDPAMSTATMFLQHLRAGEEPLTVILPRGSRELN